MKIFSRLMIAASLSILMSGCPEEVPGVTLPDVVNADTGADTTGDVPSDVVADTVDVSPDTEPDAVEDVTPDADPDVVEDVTPDTDPEIVEDVTPDTDPEIVEDVTPDTVEDVTPDADPEIIEDVTPDADPEIVEDIIADANPDLIEDATPDVVEDVTPDADADIGGVCEGPGGFNVDATFGGFDTASGPIYFVQYIPTTSHDLVAVDYFTAAGADPSTAKVAVYDDDGSGLPDQTNTLALGFLTADDAAGWATAVMDVPVALIAGEVYWVTFEAQTDIKLPWVSGDGDSFPVTYVWSLAGSFIDIGNGPYFQEPWMVRFKDCE